MTQTRKTLGKRERAKARLTPSGAIVSANLSDPCKPVPKSDIAPHWSRDPYNSSLVGKFNEDLGEARFIYPGGTLAKSRVVDRPPSKPSVVEDKGELILTGVWAGYRRHPMTGRYTR